MQNWNQWQLPTATSTGSMPQPPTTPGYPAPGADPMATMQAYMQYYNQPAPSGYTAEQWATAQQQNWAQWTQWQQQYQQWQAQYGTKYQDAMKQMSSGTSGIPPIPSIQPPPLPKEDFSVKPPLPPDSSNSFRYGSSVPLPHQNDLPLFPYKNLENPPLPPDQPPPPPGNPPNDVSLAGSKRSANIDLVTGSAKKSKNEEEELTEAEKTFDNEFKHWEEQFNEWKQKNANHPDKAQYKQYEAKWTSWREKLIERREQMRKKRETQKLKAEAEKKKNLQGGEKILNILSSTENQGLLNNLLGIGKTLGLTGKEAIPEQSTMMNTSVQNTMLVAPTMTTDMTQQAWAAQQWAAHYSNVANMPMANYSGFQQSVIPPTVVPPPIIPAVTTQQNLNIIPNLTGYAQPPPNQINQTPNFNLPPPGFPQNSQLKSNQQNPQGLQNSNDESFYKRDNDSNNASYNKDMFDQSGNNNKLGDRFDKNDRRRLSSNERFRGNNSLDRDSGINRENHNTDFPNDRFNNPKDGLLNRDFGGNSSNRGPNNNFRNDSFGNRDQLSANEPFGDDQGFSAEECRFMDQDRFSGDKKSFDSIFDRGPNDRSGLSDCFSGRNNRFNDDKNRFCLDRSMPFDQFGSDRFNSSGQRFNSNENDSNSKNRWEDDGLNSNQKDRWESGGPNSNQKNRWKGDGSNSNQKDRWESSGSNSGQKDRWENLGLNSNRSFGRNDSIEPKEPEISPELKKLMEKRRAAIDVFKPSSTFLGEDKKVGGFGLGESFRKITGDSPFSTRDRPSDLGRTSPSLLSGRPSFGPEFNSLRTRDDSKSRGRLETFRPFGFALGNLNSLGPAQDNFRSEKSNSYNFRSSGPNSDNNRPDVGRFDNLRSGGPDADNFRAPGPRGSDSFRPSGDIFRFGPGSDSFCPGRPGKPDNFRAVEHGSDRFRPVGPNTDHFRSGVSSSDNFRSSGSGPDNFRSVGPNTDNFRSGGSAPDNFRSGRPGPDNFRSGGPGSNNSRPGGPGSDNFCPGAPGSDNVRSSGSSSDNFRPRGGEFDSSRGPGLLKIPQEMGSRGSGLLDTPREIGSRGIELLEIPRDVIARGDIGPASDLLRPNIPEESSESKRQQNIPPLEMPAWMDPKLMPGPLGEINAEPQSSSSAGEPEKLLDSQTNSADMNNSEKKDDSSSKNQDVSRPLLIEPEASKVSDVLPFMGENDPKPEDLNLEPPPELPDLGPIKGSIAAEMPFPSRESTDNLPIHSTPFDSPFGLQEKPFKRPIVVPTNQLGPAFGKFPDLGPFDSRRLSNTDLQRGPTNGPFNIPNSDLNRPNFGPQRLDGPRSDFDERSRPKGPILGPRLPENLGTRLPELLAPRLPENMGPRGPESLGPRLPEFLGPRLPENIGPRAPKNLGPRLPELLGPRLLENLEPRGPDNFGSRGLDSFGHRGRDNFGPRGPDVFVPHGPDSFRPRGRNSFRSQELDNLGPRGPERFGSDNLGLCGPNGLPRGLDNFGPDNFGPRGSDNFGSREPDNFGPRGLDNFGPRGPNDFGPSGPDSFGLRDGPGIRRPDSFGLCGHGPRGLDNFGSRGPDGTRSLDNLGPRKPDIFGPRGPDGPGPRGFNDRPFGPPDTLLPRGSNDEDISLSKFGPKASHIEPNEPKPAIPSLLSFKFDPTKIGNDSQDGLMKNMDRSLETNLIFRNEENRPPYEGTKMNKSFPNQPELRDSDRWSNFPGNEFKVGTGRQMIPSGSLSPRVGLNDKIFKSPGDASEPGKSVLPAPDEPLADSILLESDLANEYSRRPDPQPGYRRDGPMRDFCIGKQFNYNHGGGVRKEVHDEYLPSKVVDYGHIRKQSVQEYRTPAQSFDYLHGGSKPIVPEHEIFPKMDYRHWLDNEHNIEEYNEGMRVYALRKIQKIKERVGIDGRSNRKHDPDRRRHDDHRRFEDPKRFKDKIPPWEHTDPSKRSFHLSDEFWNHKKNQDWKELKDREINRIRSEKRGKDKPRDTKLDKNSEDCSKRSNSEADWTREKVERTRRDTHNEFNKDDERSKGNLSWQENSTMTLTDSSTHELSKQDESTGEPKKTMELGKTPSYTLVESLLYSPGRQNRAPKIVIVLRGPPGSGKSFIAKVIKDKEMEQGGSAPRILSLDDYFLTEKDVESTDDNGKKIITKEMVYEYEEAMESSYITSLVKAFKKNITDGFFNFIILDSINEKISDYEEMWSFAKTKGFKVYVCEMEMDVQICLKRNIHSRTEDEVNRIVDYFEPTPSYHEKLDVSSLQHNHAIQEVQMKDSETSKNEKSNEANDDSQDSQDDKSNPTVISKWEKMEAEDKLDRLDGLAKRKHDGKPQTMEGFLQVPDYYNMEDSSGKKRVRWADLEERKEQEKMRAVGFVVGQTNWDRMMDPTKGSSALIRTKYI